VENRKKLLKTKFAEDLNPKFSVGSDSKGLHLRMTKFGVTATVAVKENWFFPDETDYRASKVEELYREFADAQSGDINQVEPATPLPPKNKLDFSGGGVAAGTVHDPNPPAPHEQSTEELKSHTAVLHKNGSVSIVAAEEEELASPNLQQMNVANAKDVVERVESPEVLQSLKVQELDGKRRKTVLEAIDAALEGFAE